MVFGVVIVRINAIANMTVFVINSTDCVNVQKAIGVIDANWNVQVIDMD